MTPDLDVLTALLAAATPGHRYANAELAREAVNALPSLIEAARREAGLRRLVENLVAAYEADYPKGGLASALSNVALDARIFLLHDNAGTAER